MRDDCGYRAMIDIAENEPEGLVELSEQDAKVVIRHLARRLSLDAVVERIAHCENAVRLLCYLPQVYGFESQSLRPVACAVLRQHRDFDDTEDLTQFADIYWSAALHEMIVAGEYRKAWTLLKLACCGEKALNDRTDWELPALVKGEPIGLFPSIACGRRLTQDLYAALEKKGIVSEPLQKPLYSADWGPDWPVGVGVATAIKGHDPETGVFLVHGLQALAIAANVTPRAIAVAEARAVV